jgi:hypothetical protein
MSSTRTTRPIPLALTALVALFSALVALAVTNGHDAHAHPAAAVTPQTALEENMRMLWEDHIVWTRLAIISLTTGAPDTKATVGRLLRNQVDIGNAVKPFYGKAAGAKVTAELRRHILIAADVIAAAKAGNKAKLADASARWQRNADDIARVLSSVNPHFDFKVLKAEMSTHLKLTTQEVVARLQGKWGADVAAYDRIHKHILHMADYLSAGLVKQFPQRFR